MELFSERCYRENTIVMGDCGACGSESSQVLWMRPDTNGDNAVNDSFVTQWNSILENVLLTKDDIGESAHDIVENFWELPSSD
jgi:hypothetical protein